MIAQTAEVREQDRFDVGALERLLPRARTCRSLPSVGSAERAAHGVLSCAREPTVDDCRRAVYWTLVQSPVDSHVNNIL
jgi:hypothetical protein